MDKEEEVEEKEDKETRLQRLLLDLHAKVRVRQKSREEEKNEELHTEHKKVSIPEPTGLASELSPKATRGD